MVFTLFVVDDAKSARILIESAFAEEFRVISFESGEACLEYMENSGECPGVFLLDINMPGMDGFTLCRRLRERPWGCSAPVIFVSARDDLESRIEGYDAGGSDFIVKPFSVIELRRKIEALRELREEQQVFSRTINDSENLNALLLANLDEYAALIGFLRKLNDCEGVHGLLDLLFDLLDAYHLQAAVQIRLPGQELTVSKDGQNLPLEVSVVNHVRGMGRIFEFSTRGAYNYDNITVLINNMPTADPDHCGRLRDHLAIAAECAQAKLTAMQIKAENTQARGDLAGMLQALDGEVQNIERRHARARYQGALLSMNLMNELGSAFTFLGLTELQEQKILDVVQNKAEELVHIYDFSEETEGTLRSIAERLSAMLRPTVVLQAELAEHRREESSSPGSGVELF